MGKNATGTVKIGVIDSGVSENILLSIKSMRNFCDSDKQALDRLGHGTAVASVIVNNANRVSLYIARVFNDKLTCPTSRVASAIDWLVEQQVDIINMSFGLRNDRDEVKYACKRAIDKGLWLIAASPAQGEAVYPAEYPAVIRATGDARCKPGQLSKLASLQADYGGCPRYSGLSPTGASIGCASVTAAVAKILAENPQTDVLSHLDQHASFHGRERRTSLPQSEKVLADTKP